MSDRRRLVLLSFLMLFVELALIRWTGSNVVYLSYFSNFVLLGSFLGIGIGFLRGGSRRDLFPLAPIALAVLVVFVRVFPVTIDRSGGDLIYFASGFSKTGLPTWVTLPVVFLLVSLVMTCIAQGVARVFSRFEPLEAYRLDILGSLCGIVAFTVLSFLRVPPVVWGAIASVLFLWLTAPRRLVPVVAGAVLVGVLTAESLAAGDSWSPYYKVTTREKRGGVIFIDVNGVPHQDLERIEQRRARDDVRFKPYERAIGNPLRDVLIVGAGNGSDVAIALSQGAAHVDAVEIDPRLYEIGRGLHPDRPYQDRRVDIHIDDGRAYLERTDKHYDLILFALPDSLTLVSGQSSLRLESFLFTQQMMTTAREHLRPGGVFAMYNYFRERWLVDRLASMLATTYGRPPCLDLVSRLSNLALLTAAPDSRSVRCETPWRPEGSIAPPPSDDYPFLYLRHRRIPAFYVLTIALILALSVVATRAVGGPIRRMRGFTDLFFMGAAFLLLETKSVVQFALLFGTTWLVNALVFAGILLSVLAAVEVARRISFRRPARLYGLLLACVGVALLVPQSALFALPFWPRFLAAVLLAFSPIFVANLVFAERFARVGESTSAFGANLLGAMAGGVLEYVSLVTGYRALLILVAILYGAAFLTRPRAMEPLAARG